MAKTESFRCQVESKGGTFGFVQAVFGGGSMERCFVTTNLGQVHVVVDGDAGAPPVVLLHQTPRSTDEFAEVTPLLARSMRVIAIDTPGYGASDHPSTPPGMGDYAGAVAEVIQEVAEGPAHICGHHTGAIIAVEVGAAYPEVTRKIIASGLVYVDDGLRSDLGPRFRQWKIQADGSHLSAHWDRLSHWTSPNSALTQRLLLDVYRAGETSEFGHWACLDYDMEARLPMVRRPVLILTGNDDPFITPGMIRSLTDALPDTQVSYIDGSVFLPNENPAGFAEAILSFVGRGESLEAT